MLTITTIVAVIVISNNNLTIIVIVMLVVKLRILRRHVCRKQAATMPSARALKESTLGLSGFKVLRSWLRGCGKLQVNLARLSWAHIVRTLRCCSRWKKYQEVSAVSIKLPLLPPLTDQEIVPPESALRVQSPRVAPPRSTSPTTFKTFREKLGDRGMGT